MLRTVRNILNYKTAIKKEFHYDETGTFVVGSHDIWFNADEIISVLHVRKAQEKNSDVSYVSQDIYYSLYLIATVIKNISVYRLRKTLFVRYGQR